MTTERGESEHESFFPTSPRLDLQYDYLLKVVLLGDPGVGKSNLMTRFVSDSFTPENKSTIGVEFASKLIKVNPVSRGTTLVKAQIWDTAGQERFRAIVSAYYRGAAAALVVYDITKFATFLSCDRWIGELREYSKDAVVMMVGNKADLSHLREVSRDVAAAYATRMGILFTEASALEDTNVEIAFSELIKNGVDAIIGRREGHREAEAPPPISLTPIEKDESKEGSKETEAEGGRCKCVVC